MVLAIITVGDATVVALEKTFEQLDVLADAGAVDAGGRGLLVLLNTLRLPLTGVPACTVYELSPCAVSSDEKDDVTGRRAPQF